MKLVNRNFIAYSRFISPWSATFVSQCFLENPLPFLCTQHTFMQAPCRRLARIGHLMWQEVLLLVTGMGKASMDAKQTFANSIKHKAVVLSRCTLLHRVAVLRRHMPRQVKPVTCVFELGPHWWRVCSCISMCLNPMGCLYFCFLSHAWAHRETDTHSHVSNLESCCCQKMIQAHSMCWQTHTHKQTLAH